QPAGEAPVPPGAVGQQVVVEAADVPGDAPGERVPLAGPLVLPVPGEVQRLRNDAPLEGEVPPLPGAEPLVDAPADRTVVEDDVIAPPGPAPVLGDAGLVADADAEVADDDVVGLKTAECVVPDADAVARCGLPRDREVRVTDDQLRLQRDDPADAEHHRPRAGGLDRLTQAARAGIVQVRYLVHLAAPAADGEPTVA